MNCPWDTAIDADPSPAVRSRLIHVSSGAAVHVQPAEVVIVSEKPVPCQCSVNSNGDTEYPQFVGGGGVGVAPACRTTNAWPATVIVDCRFDEAVWADTEKVTVPFPVPTEPDPMESQASDDAAVHEQPAPAVTVIAPAPPVEAKS
jgi:hypothetical protein